MRVVANQEWGAHKSVLLKLYRSLIRSKIDYGCIVYGSARPLYICRILLYKFHVFVTNRMTVERLSVDAPPPSLLLRKCEGKIILFQSTTCVHKTHSSLLAKVNGKHLCKILSQFLCSHASSHMLQIHLPYLGKTEK